jgi:serine-type D-Ala-D-Ala carboxypeptidase/endopeptidase (penicillin-binding protein 4)
MRSSLVLLFLAILNSIYAQSVEDKLAKSIKQLEADPQMRHAILGFYVADAKANKTVYEHHAQTGLAAASTQKLFTSVAAFEMLGKDYRYTTAFSHDGKIENGILKGNLFITGSGDPTWGSWRWAETKSENILNNIIARLKQNSITRVEGNIYLDEPGFSIQPLPEGWIWQDIGNYYGAGSWGINWHENQYDLKLVSGDKVNDTARILKAEPQIDLKQLVNHIQTGEKGSGDNAYIYWAPYSGWGFANGTIPIGEKSFSISGAMPHPATQFKQELELQLQNSGITVTGNCKTYFEKIEGRQQWPKPTTTLFNFLSPPLDSINYWFLKKSINLYGEALIKTISLKQKAFADTQKGVSIVKDFWAKQGIESSAIQIMDGSGLSPQNRVTAWAEVKVLLYAKTRPWFASFYNALPLYNGMKMKSGSIGGARAFAGYHTSKSGTEYIFSIIVNNYDGSSAEMVKKLYKILDELK